jgi:NAD(P)-dependent dehydrogenase (short-subunit alcohol dehydrogenase family)
VANAAEPASAFTADRPVAVVTGASSGIGRSTARKLVADGWQVIGTGRDPRRCAETEAGISAVASASQGRFALLRGDFDLMAEVARVAGEIRARTPRLDVLINNAGGVRDRRIVTAEGTEATFAANHLAPFLLTRELLPLLRASATGLPPGAVRVLAVSSSAHRMSRGLDWEDLQTLDRFRTGTAYARAKLANLLFTRELARCAAPDGVIAQGMHPGRVASNFASHGDKAFQEYMATADTVPPDEPADTLHWLATSPEAGHTPGRYFHQRMEETPSAPALDDAAATRLWAASARLLAELGR